MIADSITQPGNQMLYRNRAGVEELLHQIIIAFCDEFHNLLVAFLRRVS